MERRLENLMTVRQERAPGRPGSELSTRLANHSVVSLRVIFGLCSGICGSDARGAGLPPSWSASPKTRA